ncbi:MAG: helix-turn-helix domain-containing protein [Planctomycetes bacterium]|nr:helix-turn-helix domain-containing protein [Planctomycetota bacterium]
MDKKAITGLLRSVKEMAAIHRGEMKPAREFRLVKGKLREVAPEARPRGKTRSAPPPIDVTRVRKQLGLSQSEFADVFKIPLKTLRNWEQGIRRPEGPAQVLLRVIAKQPAAVLASIH